MKLSMRSIGGLVLGLTALWYVVLIRAFTHGKLFAAGLVDFLAIVYLVVPVLTARLGIAMIRAVIRSPGNHPIASWTVIVLGMTPLAIFAFLFVVS